MGHDVFSMKKYTRQDDGRSISLMNKSSVFQLLITSFLSTAEKRNGAIENLSKAISRQKTASRGVDVEQVAAAAAASSGSSGE
jgi:hypothetical protein